MSNRIKFVLIFLGAATIAMVLGVLVGEQDLFRLAVVASALIFLVLLPNPALVGLFAVIFHYSGLTAPGIPGKLNFFYLSALGLCGIMLFQLALNRLKKIQWGASHTLMVCFAGVIVATILVRGAGFRVLGQDTWGGMTYVQIFILMMLVVALPQAGMKPKWWPRAIVAMSLLSVLPLIADTLIIMGVDPSIIWRVVQGSSQIGLSLQADVSVQQGVVRYFSAGVAGQLLLVGFLAVVNINKLFTVKGCWMLPLPFLFFGITMAGGYRLGLVNFALIAVITAYFQRAFTVPRIFIGIMIGILAWYALVEVSPYLPPGAQRTVSWVPGADIPIYVKQDATGTVDWRLDLWREAMKKLPDYWLIGKGYAFSEKEAVGVTGANMGVDPIAWALVTSSYHNGPISLLLGLGVFGLVIGSSLLVAVSIRHYRILKEPWHHPALRQCHQVIFAMLLVYVGLFFSVYGDVQTTIPSFLFMFALLEALRLSDRHHAAQKEAPAEAEPIQRPRRRARR